VKTIAAAAAALALLAASACSTSRPAPSGHPGQEGDWGLSLDGQATQFSREGGRYVSFCTPQHNGDLGMVWSRYGLNGSTDGTITAFINADKTVRSLAVRLDTGTTKTQWQSYDYGPGSSPGTSASVVSQDGVHYHITGTLQGGPAPAGTEFPLQAPLHAFDLKITCVTND
jgi:hypothetical protein